LFVACFLFFAANIDAIRRYSASLYDDKAVGGSAWTFEMFVALTDHVSPTPASAAACIIHGTVGGRILYLNKVEYVNFCAGYVELASLI